MLLKIGAKVPWSFKDKSNATFQDYLRVLIKITSEQGYEEDKTKAYWEKALLDAW